MSILREEVINQAPVVSKAEQSLPPAPAPTAAEQSMSEENLEQAVISLLVSEPGLESAGHLAVKDFGTPAFRSIFSALHRLNERNVPVDVISLWGEMDAHKDTGAVQTIDNLYELIRARSYVEDTAGKFSTYTELLRGRSQRKEFIRISDYLHTQLLRGQAEGLSAEELGQLFSKADAAATRLSADEEEETFEDATDRLMDFYKHGDDTKRIPTGIGALDAQLNGGFLPEKVITIGANSGYGKSVLGLQIALNASMAQGLRTVFFSLEMGRDEVIHRANSSMCQIPFQVLTDNKADKNSRERLLDDYEYKHLRDNMTRLRSGTLTIEDKSRLSTSGLRSALSRAQSEGRPYRMVVLDYLAQLEADKRQDDERLRISAIMEDLKRIAKEYKTTIVLLAQTQRDMENAPVKDAMMNSLRGSGSIENASDIILLIGKVDTVELTAAEIEPERYRAIKVMKNRMGTPGRTINVEFEGMYQRFCDLNARPSEKLKAVGSLIPFEEVSDKNDHPAPSSPTAYAEQARLHEQLSASPDSGGDAW